MRKTAKYRWRDGRTNEDILNELKVTSVLDKLQIIKVTGYNTQTECQDLEYKIY
jgi:hypothetical protein